MPFCTQCGTENPAEARFCAACGTALAEVVPAAPPSEERKVITAIFVDLVGSTARSEQLDPEDVKALVAPYHTRVRAELERHGGTFEKFSGDAVLALFGTPKAHEDDPERAVRAGLAIRKAIAELNAEDEWLDLHIRIGIHTGEALIMLGARPSEGEWSAAGDVLNTAARIQSAAPTDGILVGDQTYLAAKDAFDFREADAIEAKGKAEPVSVWEVTGERADARGRPRVDLPLIGRLEELEELSAFCDRVLEERHVGVVTIIGSPGIGKSRLLLEVVRLLEDRWDVHWGRCLSYGDGITYWPIEEIVEDAAGILYDDDPAETAAKLAALLEALDTTDQDELRSIAAAVSNLAGVATTPRGQYSAAEIGKAELHWGVRRLLELRAGRRPTVVVIEDLHWAEPTLLELLAYLGASEADAPLLVVGTARPEVIETRSPIFISNGSRLALRLDALSIEDSTMLISELVPEGVQVPVERLLEASGGNPLFLEETVRMMADVGAEHEGEQIPVPSNIHALIASRLDQLGPAEKSLAQNASVIGPTFWPSAVAAMNGIGGDLEDRLAELERRDLVRPTDASRISGEREYGFKHVLIREVSYGQVPKGRRAVLHRRFADWADTQPGLGDDFIEVVAYHLEQACLTAREVARPLEEPPIVQAAESLARAAAKAERREGFREAHQYYTRALDVLDAEQVELRIELRLRRGDILMMLGDLKEASAELEEVADAASAFDRVDVQCEAALLLGDIDQRQGRASDAHERLTTAQTLALSTGNGYLRSKVAFVLAALVADFDGQYEQAIDNLREGISTAEEIDDVALVAEGHLRLAAILMNRGELAAAETELRCCLKLAGELGSHRVEAEATSWLGMITYHIRDPEEGQRLCGQARTWFERTGDSYFQAQNIVRGLAIFALADGQMDEAETWLREAMPVAAQIGGWVAVETYRYLAEVLAVKGRLEEARDLVALAERNLPQEDAYARSSLLLAEASVATASGDSAAAAVSFTEALRMIEELEMPLELGEARMALGRSLRSFGDLPGARAELERAREIFGRIGATTRRDAIDAELERLVEGPAAAGPSTGV
ncbi:MAG TPA: adenylate/guanylate cyclase domain-containing protein [Gaiellaceae bacterium]|nr:adenylate/guanylate cyclase domain-containing protein [Gaiellaceae bacterium]